MPWVKLDENFFDHPKVSAAGLHASWAFLSSVAYANRHLTNGFVPDTELESVTRYCGKLTEKQRGEIAAKLVSVGLWERVTCNGRKGFQIHDYLEYQPSRRKVHKQKRESALRVARWRKAHRKKNGHA